MVRNTIREPGEFDDYVDLRAFFRWARLRFGMIAAASFGIFIPLVAVMVIIDLPRNHRSYAEVALPEATDHLVAMMSIERLDPQLPLARMDLVIGLAVDGTYNDKAMAQLDALAAISSDPFMMGGAKGAAAEKAARRAVQRHLYIEVGVATARVWFTHPDPARAQELAAAAAQIFHQALLFQIAEGEKLLAKPFVKRLERAKAVLAVPSEQDGAEPLSQSAVMVDILNTQQTLDLIAAQFEQARLHVIPPSAAMPATLDPILPRTANLQLALAICVALSLMVVYLRDMGRGVVMTERAVRRLLGPVTALGIDGDGGGALARRDLDSAWRHIAFLARKRGIQHIVMTCLGGQDMQDLCQQGLTRILLEDGQGEVQITISPDILAAYLDSARIVDGADLFVPVLQLAQVRGREVTRIASLVQETGLDRCVAVVMT